MVVKNGYVKKDVMNEAKDGKMDVGTSATQLSPSENHNVSKAIWIDLGSSKNAEDILAISLAAK